MADVSTKNPHLEELGQFLRARRGELDPTVLGLPAPEPGTRRVPGLRRVEVAAHAAISQDYYNRIEQGRLAPSTPVLDALADTLALTPVQRTYLEGLARRADPRTTPARRSVPPRPQLQRLLDQLILTPAFAVGKYLDYLAWNPLAGALLLDLDTMAPHERNYVRMLFADPRMKDFYDDWETMARTGVALLRMQAADNPRDPRLADLVGELYEDYPLFRQWWESREVASQDFGTKTIHHPELGAFTFDWDSFYCKGDPDQHITVWSPAPGSASEDKLRILSARLGSVPPRI
jgi:transcriptional regulator with XRE-family HTH domain